MLSFTRCFTVTFSSNLDNGPQNAPPRWLIALYGASARDQTAQCGHSSESGHNKLQRGHCDWVLLDNCNSRMSQCCCVPNCENKKGGHLFTKNEAMKQKWHLVLQHP